ncbi:MAG TPA: hypothetical protein EYH22_00315 [Candidatus Nanopusillus sp.]|nr:hypothetical protein [Candidatus Nanopusillus sp.]
MRLSRSQSQIIGYVALAALITGITLGVYFWGVPVMEKSRAVEAVSSVELQLSRLADFIGEAGLKGIDKSLDFLYSGRLEISSNKISYTIEIPLAIYASNYNLVPINYKFFFKCSSNNTVSPGSSVYLCGNKKLLATANNTHLIIKDLFYNKTIILPKGNHKDIIVQVYVFDITWDGVRYTFIWKGNVGYLGFEDNPPCLVNALVSGSGDSQVITYDLSCRPLLDPQTRKCIWIKIIPQGQTGVSGEGTVTFNIKFTDSKIKDYSAKSTICDYLEEKIVAVSIR